MLFAFRVTKFLARVIYFWSGFVVMGGLIVAFFIDSIGSVTGWIIAGAGVAMWAVSKLLAPLAVHLFGKLDEEDRERADRSGELRAAIYTDETGGWGF